MSNQLKITYPIIQGESFYMSGHERERPILRSLDDQAILIQVQTVCKHTKQRSWRDWNDLVESWGIIINGKCQMSCRIISTLWGLSDIYNALQPRREKYLPSNISEKWVNGFYTLDSTIMATWWRLPESIHAIDCLISLQMVKTQLHHECSVCLLFNQH